MTSHSERLSELHQELAELYSRIADLESVETVTDAEAALLRQFEASELMPALLCVASVLAFGLRKYPDNKWKRLETEEHVEHMVAHAVRMQTDEESGLPDAAHAACRALMALGVELSHGK